MGKMRVELSSNGVFRYFGNEKKRERGEGFDGLKTFRGESERWI